MIAPWCRSSETSHFPPLVWIQGSGSRLASGSLAFPDAAESRLSKPVRINVFSDGSAGPARSGIM